VAPASSKRWADGSLASPPFLHQVHARKAAFNRS
jgi:hypothetical protein